MVREEAQPKFAATIIIPLLRQVDAWLGRAVQSALDQTEYCEVLVIGSPHTPQCNLTLLQELSRYSPNLQVILQRPGTQFAAALNLGIEHASAERIGFLMSDDWLDPRAVAACRLRDEDIVSTARTFYAADGTTELRELTETHTEAAYRRLQTAAERATYLNHFFLIRKAALESVGGIDEALGNTPGIDDFDLLWCLLEQGASVGIVEASLYNYRDHEETRLTKSDPAAMLATFERILDKHSLQGAERRKLLAQHKPWFGKSMWARYQEFGPSWVVPFFFRPLQRMYRGVVPLSTRIALHEHLSPRAAKRVE